MNQTVTCVDVSPGFVPNMFRVLAPRILVDSFLDLGDASLHGAKTRKNITFILTAEKTSNLIVFSTFSPSVRRVHEDTFWCSHRKHRPAGELRPVPQHRGQERRSAGVQRAAVSGHHTVRSGGRLLVNRRPSKAPGHEGSLLRGGTGRGKWPAVASDMSSP